MISLTERYLAVVLRSIPERQRADLDSELQSSIADAVEDRVAAGEDRVVAEESVLEGLGNPARLAAEYAGRPLHLIGPELYLVYTHLLTRLAAIVVPIVFVVITGLELMDGMVRSGRLGGPSGDLPPHARPIRPWPPKEHKWGTLRLQTIGRRSGTRGRRSSATTKMAPTS